MLSLHTNAASLSTQNSLGSTNKALTSSMTKLGTGYRINSSQDDAAGLQIATRLNAQTSGMKVAQKNTQNGISLLQTADGALSEISNMAIRMKDLATEKANGTNTTDDTAAIDAEMKALGTQIGEIFSKTSFAGKAVFGAGGFLAGALTFQVGQDTNETISYTAALGTVGTAPADTSSISALETYIKDVGTLRSDIGAVANRLEHVYNNLGNMIQNTDTAMGRIMDVDYATETSNMTSKQMLMQASTAMLKQSSSMSQMVASLLQ
jgi:flagellin